MRLEPFVYQASTATTSDITGQIISTNGLSMVSFHAVFTADSGAARVGAFEIWGSSDPRALEDKAHGTSNADWQILTPPSGAVHGTNATLSTTDIDVTDSAGSFIAVVERLPAFLYMFYDSGTAGTDGAVTIYCAGNGR